MRRQYRTRKVGRKAFRRYKRRFYRKKYTKNRQRIYRFTRFVDFGEFTIANNINTYVAYNFSLDDIPSVADYTTLFDMYKINAVKITFLPQMTSNISLGTVNNANASSRFFSAIDYNDGNAPTSIDQVRQYANCKYTSVIRPHTRYIYKPKILDTSGFSIAPWLSTASSNANYFGIKIAVEPMDSTSTVSMIYTVECKYYMSFKHVR